ncbi:formate dehydrogenase accessory sulfurtransferase FdhD [Bradyrhizobium sp. KBS0727]|uniref:formate dehydrogenase accessory sulfurtransferase FdhD n=1 Tax=unclassified Bradyrhizobium TaxID=2631580 RepID=UPI00110E6A4D|nr:formate dehydrogenase accessory sulfurtransferase FdhD [Bradyrhizobium sp. KBS0725]QDW42725.1 formate dehydrogenase accessory sulfurtransferase FdhD [Bradyrhizobium sp. KBS0727]
MTANDALAERKMLIWRAGRPTPSSRVVAEEKGVALTYDGTTYAVMMATPTDLHDFAVGFSITEGVVERADEISSVEVIESELGVEIRMWLVADRSRSFVARRRAIVGPVGCGLCGIESLEQAGLVPRRVVSRLKCRASDLLGAMSALAPLQCLNRQTRAMHAAAFWDLSEGISVVREDVGRHNALDKLAGALIGCNRDRSSGAVLLTSRVSVEMVQKTAMIGVPVLVAVSAPTTLAIETADQAGITLIAVARDDGYEIFTHPDRIEFSERRSLSSSPAGIGGG